MTNAQIAVKENIRKRVDYLSESEALRVLEFIDTLSEPEPNAETLQAMRDIEEGRNLIGPFDTAKELFAALTGTHSDLFKK